MRAFLLLLFIIAITGAEIFYQEMQSADCNKKGGVYVRQYGKMGVCIKAKEIK